MRPESHHTVHETTVDAPAATVFGLLADVRTWPQLFTPTVHAEYLERAGSQERLKLWATANDQVRSWISRRHLDEQGLRIDFHQELPAAPAAAMSGEWILTPLGERSTRVELTHDFRAVGDDQKALRWIDSAVDRNSTAELAALKRAAQMSAELDRAMFSFEDAVTIDGPLEEVYGFLCDAAAWPDRLPHVTRLDFTEEAKDVQVMEMDTRAKDGSVHTTRSVRVCFPHTRIVYKQLLTPALLRAHGGTWTCTPSPEGTAVVSRHHVVIEPDAVERILGPTATIEDARSFVRDALGANSRATLGHAKGFIEGYERV